MNTKLEIILSKFNIDAEKYVAVRKEVLASLEEFLDKGQNKKLTFIWLCYFVLHYVYETEYLENLIKTYPKYYEEKDELDGWIISIVGDIKKYLSYPDKEIMKDYQESTKLVPNGVGSWQRLASLEYRLGDNGKSLDHYRKALNNINLNKEAQGITEEMFNKWIVGNDEFMKTLLTEKIAKIESEISVKS